MFLNFKYTNICIKFIIQNFLSKNFQNCLHVSVSFRIFFETLNGSSDAFKTKYFKKSSSK